MKMNENYLEYTNNYDSGYEYAPNYISHSVQELSKYVGHFVMLTIRGADKPYTFHAFIHRVKYPRRGQAHGTVLLLNVDYIMQHGRLRVIEIDTDRIISIKHLWERTKKSSLK